ncbi:MAG: DUF512 domain-containing protein [Desulfuromonadales bacterium]|nr:DUF512 domain-containing protein [Desulfuromonadales bacterium]
MLKIESVVPDSYAAEFGLLAGDRLLAINGHELNDLVDYHSCIDANQFNLEVLRQNDELWELAVVKDDYTDFGLEVAHPQPHQCGNKCLFCFIHQLPKGMRRSLYIKDEDYRFSYLYGSYITLTNLTEVDLQRIIADQLSPLYISVHATDHPLRETLLGTKIPEILPLLKRLTAAGIELHCQVVLCPGLNDGEALSQTIEDLVALQPQVVSLAVVPVGLTSHRSNLPELQPVTKGDATRCLQLIHRYQQQFLAQAGTRFVFPADEFYLLAQENLPTYGHYEDFPQIENGVGMIAQFRQQIDEVLLETEALELDKITLVTGCLFQDELKLFAERIGQRAAVEVAVVAIKNDFFGAEVTVTGLITGSDLINQLQGLPLGSGVVIPEVMLKDGGTLFLDDISIDAASQALGVPVIAVENSPWGILDGLEQLAEGEVEVVHLG